MIGPDTWRGVCRKTTKQVSIEEADQFNLFSRLAGALSSKNFILIALADDADRSDVGVICRRAIVQLRDSTLTGVEPVPADPQCILAGREIVGQPNRMGITHPFPYIPCEGLVGHSNLRGSYPQHQARR